MFLVDTHTHIFSEEFDADVSEVLLRAQEGGVGQFYLPNIDIQSIPRLLSLSDAYPELCFPMMGLHPTSVCQNYLEELAVIRKELAKRKYIAIGEIGIDLYWDKTFLSQQISAFEEQLRWSIELDIPVAIHTREAFPEVFNSLYKIGVDKLRGVFHSFGGSKEELEEALNCKNFMLGINGVITYKKATFRDYLAIAPLERIVLETDAPYLTPVPHRGKRNEPSYLIHIAHALAEVYNVSLETIAQETTANAKRLFSTCKNNSIN
ncbi:TatD family hydrolase [Bacteroidales bacterium OttesenSCG-928-M06]|nr:TatD family hydrolase [Bacteroidales bacterium OttesenSCG-928-M06]